MAEKDNLVRFDWAVKRLLRQKSNFVVLEGLFSTLLGESIHIVRLLESEGNKKDAEDKFNRVDMLAENSKNELIIIEVQNNRELDYFHRMLYGTSKVVSEYIHSGDDYDKVRKVYSVNIVYFTLGQGKDYVYHGKTEFRGIHNNDLLKLSVEQQKQFTFQDAGDLFPEYYILRVDDFDQKAVTPLDEWIAFLKTGQIDEHPRAEGLAEARERLRIDRLSPGERKSYYDHMEALRYQRSVIKTGLIEGKAEGRAEGKAEGLKEGLQEGLKEGEVKGRQEEKLRIALQLKAMGLPEEQIMAATGLSSEQLKAL